MSSVFTDGSDLIVYSPHDEITGADLYGILELVGSRKRVIVVGSLKNVLPGNLFKVEDLVVCSEAYFFTVFPTFSNKVFEPIFEHLISSKNHSHPSTSTDCPDLEVSSINCPNVNVKLCEVEFSGVNAKSVSWLDFHVRSNSNILLVKTRGEVTGAYLASLLTDFQSEDPIVLVVQGASIVSDVSDDHLTCVEKLVLVSPEYCLDIRNPKGDPGSQVSFAKGAPYKGPLQIQDVETDKPTIVLGYRNLLPVSRAGGWQSPDIHIKVFGL